MVAAACLYGQQAMVVTVYDSATAQPVEDAIVRIMPLSPAGKGKAAVSITNKKGQVTIGLSEAAVVHVSYLGYVSVLDTVRSGESRSYYLKKTTANIDDVVVTGQYGAASAKASVYNMTVYTEKDFREKGASNLREVLQNGLNIDMSQDPVFGSGLSLQGISGEGVKIMVDGVPLVGRQNGVIDLTQIDLSNIERVEIIKGPMSAIYGSDAMGGVVNLISKSNQPEKYNINLKGYYESVGQYNVNLNGGLHFGKSQFFASAGRNFFGGYSAVNNSRQKDWLPKEQYFANAKYVYTTAKFKIGASLSFFRELMLSRGNLLPNTTYALDAHLLTLRPIGTLFATVPIRDYSKIDILVAYSGYVNFVNYYQKDLVTLEQHMRSDQQQDTTFYHTLVARATYGMTTRNKKISFQFGTDINQEYVTQNTLSNGKQDLGDYAVFSSVLLKPVTGLDIQPALRISYNTKFSTPLIPSINVKYDFAEHFSLRTSYGRGYRAPSLSELYLLFHDNNHDLNGNADLKPEDGHSVNLDFSYRFVRNGHSLKISPSGFFNKIQNKIDYIETDPSSTPVTYKRFNINQFQNAGAELLAEYAWDRLNLSAGVNHTWYWITIIQALNKLDAGDVSVKGGYRIPKAEIKVTVAYKYTGPKPLYSLSGGSGSEYGTREAFHSMDVSLSRDFWQNRIQLTCGGKNLFNVTNLRTPGARQFGHGSGDSSLTMWGRTFFISLNLHFAK